MNKRGLSAVIISLILILLAIVVSGVLWVVISNVVQTGSEEITLGSFFLDLQIENVKVESNGDVSVTVKRGAGEANLEAINFIVSDGDDSVVVREDTTLQELGTSTFTITKAELSTIALVKEVSIAPIIIEDGKEKTGRVVTTETLSNKQTLESLGAISWWKFEGNAKDEFGNNDGTIVGDISFIEGTNEQAIKDGASGHIQLDTLSSELESTLKTGSFSMALFWTPVKNSKWTDMISFDQNYGVTRFEHSNDDTNPLFSGYWWGGHNSLGGGQNYAISRSAFIPYGEEHHFVIICDRDIDELFAYIDGKEEKRGSSCESWTSITNFKFFPQNLENDVMDEIIIFDKALTVEQAKALYELDLN